jgi:hypothetical protein
MIFVCFVLFVVKFLIFTRLQLRFAALSFCGEYFYRREFHPIQVDSEVHGRIGSRTRRELTAEALRARPSTRSG